MYPGATEHHHGQLGADRLVADPDIGVAGPDQLVHLTRTCAAEEAGVEGDPLLAQRTQDRDRQRGLESR